MLPCLFIPIQHNLHDESIAQNITDLFRTYNVEELLGDLLIFYFSYRTSIAYHLLHKANLFDSTCRLTSFRFPRLGNLCWTSLSTAPYGSAERVALRQLNIVTVFVQMPLSTCNGTVQPEQRDRSGIEP